MLLRTWEPQHQPHQKGRGRRPPGAQPGLAVGRGEEKSHRATWAADSGAGEGLKVGRSYHTNTGEGQGVRLGPQGMGLGHNGGRVLSPHRGWKRGGQRLLL